MPRAAPTRLVFSYHKTGTTLFLHVMTKVCEALGLSLVNHYGHVERLTRDADVILLPHSSVGAPIRFPYRAVRLIRDPRDIWVSGYLYHLRCEEAWCVNTNLDPTPPIGVPRVDYPIVHWPETEKAQYLAWLNGESYQRNLRQRSLIEGLDFELEGYTAWTISALRAWPSLGISALDMRLEDISADFDGMMARVFDHFAFDSSQRAVASRVARTEDVRAMDDTEIARRPQITSRSLSKWRSMLSDDQIGRFEARYGDLITSLGYPLAATQRDLPDVDDVAASVVATMPRTVTDPDVVASATTRDTAFAAETAKSRGPVAPLIRSPDHVHDPDVRLEADGMILRPIATGAVGYQFVVPPSARGVTLRSRTVIRPGPANQPQPFGVAVTRITIRDAGFDRVIPADDPNLAKGWYPITAKGSPPVRWTDGAASLPWPGLDRPSLVIVQCADQTGDAASFREPRSAHNPEPVDERA